MKETPQVTLKTIAAAAGVSRSTVSRALRNHPALPTATCRRIQRIARKLKFRQNPIVSEAMTQIRGRRGRTAEVIAFVTSYPTPCGVWREVPTYRMFFEGTCQRAEQFGFRVEEFRAREPGMSSERLGLILRTRAIRGIIIAPLPSACGHLTLDWTTFAAASLGHSLARPKLHHVANHQYDSIRLALREVKRLGYLRVGLVVSSWFDSRADHNWSAGFLVWQQALPPELRIPILTAPTLTKQRLARWVEDHRPDVVLSTGALVPRWLRGMGWRVPEDVGYVSLDVTPGEGTLAGIDQNSSLVGAAAVDVVLGMLVRGERGVPSVSNAVLIEGKWSPGPTVRKV